MTESEHRWFIEECNLGEASRTLEQMADAFADEGFGDGGFVSLKAFVYLRQWRAEMLQTMANMINARNPEKIALAKIFIQAGLVKGEDMDAVLNAPGLHKIVKMYPDEVAGGLDEYE